MQISVKTWWASLQLTILILISVVMDAKSVAQESSQFSDMPPASASTQSPTGDVIDDSTIERPFPRFKPGNFTSSSPSEPAPPASTQSPQFPLQNKSTEVAPPIDENTLRNSLEPPVGATVPNNDANRRVPADPMEELSPSRLSPTGEFNLAPTQSPPSILIRRADPPANNTVYGAAENPQDRQRVWQAEPQESPRVTIQTRPERSVQPASFNAPLNPIGNSNQNSLLPAQKTLANARTLIEMYDVNNAGQPLPGVPVSMLEMLQRTPANMRIQMINQYWETYYDWASLRNRTEYLNWLTQIPTPRSQVDNLLLFTAKSDAKNQVLAAEIQLGKSQSKLQEFILDSDPHQLPPLPLDQPLISKYKTHYDWYASRQLIPAKLKGIEQMLPKTLELIVNRAETVRSAQSVTRQTQQAFTDGQSTIASVLEAGRLWQESLQGLIGSVVSYNQAVADYALTISPNKAAEQVVDMLISVPNANAVVMDSTGQTAATGSPADSPTMSTPGKRGQFIGNRLAPLDSAIGSRSSSETQPIGPNSGAFRTEANTNPSSGQSENVSRSFLPSASNSNSRYTPFAQPRSGVSNPSNSARDSFRESSSAGLTPVGSSDNEGFAPQPPSRPGSAASSKSSDFGGGSFPR